MLSTNGRLQTVNKLLIKPLSAISIYRTQAVFLVDKLTDASWDLTTWQHGSDTTTINKKSDARTFSHHFLHNRSVVGAQGKRKEVAWTLRVGMSEVLTLLPLRSAGEEWAKTFKRILPYMYQFQESRDRGVIKRCLLTRQQHLVSNRNLFSIAHLGQRWAADHSPASNHLGTGLHPHCLVYQIKLCSVSDPFVCQCRGKTSPKQILHSIRIPASYLQRDTKATVIQHQWSKHPKLHGVDADTQVFSPSTTQ